MYHLTCTSICCSKPFRPNKSSSGWQPYLKCRRAFHIIYISIHASLFCHATIKSSARNLAHASLETAVDSPLMVEKEASSDYSAFSSSSCCSSSLVMMMVVVGGCRSGLSGDEAGKGLDATESFIPSIPQSLILLRSHTLRMILFIGSNQFTLDFLSNCYEDIFSSNTPCRVNAT